MEKIKKEARISHIDVCKNACDEKCIMIDGFPLEKVEKPRLLLHSCCGPCSTSVIERLCPSYHVTVFFYNPNITDIEEYNLRKATQIEFLNKYNDSNLFNEKIEFMEGDYDTKSFYEVSRGLEGEPEGGKRCEACFRLRLENTAIKAKTQGFDVFGTTLTVSPYKNFDIITMLGTELALKYGLQYLDIDFKKKAGYQRSIELSKKYNLYRQHYCGCEFSKQED